MTTATQTDWPNSLLQLLERQHSMMDELVTLAQSQAALIADGHADQLLTLLARRQSLIDEFTTSQSQLSAYAQQLDQSVETLERDQRDRIKSLINEIGERLAQVMRCDEEDQAALRRGCEGVKKQLSSMESARHARTAYRGAPQPAVRFTDQNG